MRAAGEIIGAIGSGNEPSYEELRMACLVQSQLLFMYQNDVRNLLKGGIDAEIVREIGYSDTKMSSAEKGISTDYWNGMRQEPLQFMRSVCSKEHEQRYKLSPKSIASIRSRLAEKREEVEQKTAGRDRGRLQSERSTDSYQRS